MNILQMNVTGNDQAGWTWSVQLDGKDVFRTKPLVRDDLVDFKLISVLAAFGKNQIVSNIDRLEIRELGRLKAALGDGVSFSTWRHCRSRSPS